MELIFENIRKIIAEEADVLGDFQKQQQKKISSLLKGNVLAFDKINSNGKAVTWSGYLDNDIKWAFDSLADSKVFLSMDGKAMDTKKANALYRLVVYLENQFLSDLNQMD